MQTIELVLGSPAGGRVIIFTHHIAAISQLTNGKTYITTAGNEEGFWVKELPDEILEKLGLIVSAN